MHCHISRFTSTRIRHFSLVSFWDTSAPYSRTYCMYSIPIFRCNCEIAVEMEAKECRRICMEKSYTFRQSHLHLLHYKIYRNSMLGLWRSLLSSKRTCITFWTRYKTQSKSRTQGFFFWHKTL